MATFTERARLLVETNAKREMAKANRAFAKTDKTARALDKTLRSLSRNSRIRLDVTGNATTKASALARDVARLATAMRSTGNRTIRVKVAGAAQVSQTSRAVRELRGAMRGQGRVNIGAALSGSSAQRIRDTALAVGLYKRNRAGLRTGIAQIGAQVGGSTPARITATAKALRSYAAAAKAVPKSVTSNVAVTGRPPRTQTGGRQPVEAFMPIGRDGPTRSRTPRVTGIDRRFPGNLPAAVNRGASYAVAGEAYNLGRQTVLAGGRAIGGRSNEQMTQRLMALSGDERDAIHRAASDALLTRKGSSYTEALSVGRNALMAGADPKGLTGLVGSILDAQTAMKPLLGEAGAARFGEQAPKIVDLAGKMDAPERAQDMVRAIGAAQLVAGRDLNMGKVLTALRNTNGLVMGMSPEAMAGFVTTVEEQERRAATGLRSTDRLLNSNNLPDKNMQALIAAGLRTKEGAVDGEMFTRDPLRWIDKHIGQRAKRDGVDTSSLDAVRRYVTTLGFQQSDTSFISAVVLKEMERARARKNVARIKPDDVNDLRTESIVLALDSVQAKFDDLASSGTTFADKVLAPILAGVADNLEALSKGKVSPGTLGALVGAGAVGAGKVAVENADVIALAFAAKKHMGAAAALKAAALALSRSSTGRGVGVGGDVGGDGRDKKDPRRKGKPTFGRDAARNVGKGGALVTGAALLGRYLGKAASIAFRKGLGPAGDALFAPPVADGERRDKTKVPRSQADLLADVVKGTKRGGTEIDPSRFGSGGPAAPSPTAARVGQQMVGRFTNVEQLGRLQALQAEAAATTQRQSTVQQAFGSDVARAEGAAAQSQAAASATQGAVAAAQGVPVGIAGAFSEGAAVAASAIRSALASGVNVNVQAAPQTNTGTTAVGAR